MNLLGGGVHPPLALARGGAGGGVLFFMIKQKIIRDKTGFEITVCESRIDFHFSRSNFIKSDQNHESKVSQIDKYIQK